MKKKYLEKIKAAGIHMLISAVVGFLISLLIYKGWYPGILSAAMNVSSVAFVVLAVDVVLGPLLTFIVFNSNKKSLEIDLAVVGVVQVVALMMGLHSIYQGRPVWLVFVEDRFEIARYSDIDAEFLKNISVEPSFFKPTWAAVPLMNEKQKEHMFAEVLKGRSDAAFRPNLYKSVVGQWQEIKIKSINSIELEKFNSSLKVGNGLKDENQGHFQWLPLVSPSGSYVIKMGERVGDLNIVDLRGG